MRYTRTLQESIKILLNAAKFRQTCEAEYFVDEEV